MTLFTIAVLMDGILTNQWTPIGYLTDIVFVFTHLLLKRFKKDE